MLWRLVDQIPKPFHGDGDGDRARLKSYILECKRQGTMTLLPLVRGMVVGPAGSGKTTIMRCLEGWNHVGELPDVESTMGINIMDRVFDEICVTSELPPTSSLVDLTFGHPSSISSNHDTPNITPTPSTPSTPSTTTRLQLWDVAGQQVYLDSHLVFVSDHNLVIYVCDLSKVRLIENNIDNNNNDDSVDIRDLIGDAQLWLGSIWSSHADVMVSMIGTHVDQIPTRKKNTTNTTNTGSI